MKKAAVVLCLVGAAAGLAGGLYGGGFVIDRFFQPEAEAETGGEEPLSVSFDPVRRELVRETVEAVGTTRAIRSVEIQPQAAGLVTAIDIPSGTRVEEGHVLVQLDDRAERAGVRQAEAVLAEAQGAFDRARALTDQNVTSDASLDTAEALVLSAEAELDTARNALGDRQIVAPFAGTLGLSDIEIGQRLEPTSIVVGLDDLSAVEIAFTLPESLFSRVAIGQPLVARGAGEDSTFQGEVTEIATRIDPVARYFEVRGLFDNSSGELATGMFMNVELQIEERRSLTVAETGIVDIADESFVFVPQDGVAQRRVVETGLRQGERVEILEGLEEGAEVVTTGLQALEDGDPITEAPDDPPAPEGEAGDEDAGAGAEAGNEAASAAAANSRPGG